MMNRFIAHNMPKIELHCHLDGSVSLPLIQKLMQQEGKEPLGLEELREKLVAPMDCSSLAEYLEKFELPLGCLQTKEGLSAAAQDLALSAAKEQVKYLEVRFAPAFSMEQGLSVREILESVRDGLKKAEEKADILTGMIVCTMRNLETEKNIAMLKEAREFLGNGVVACDLAGDEKAYPTAAFADVFATAKKYGMPYTIHAGECGSREEIRTAIELGTSRIGHGIAMSGDEELKKEVAEKKIGVELCPTSNLQTKAGSRILQTIRSGNFTMPEFCFPSIRTTVPSAIPAVRMNICVWQKPGCFKSRCVRKFIWLRCIRHLRTMIPNRYYGKSGCQCLIYRPVFGIM